MSTSTRLARLKTELDEAEDALTIEIERARARVTSAKFDQTRVFKMLDLPWNDVQRQKVKASIKVVLAEWEAAATRERLQRGQYLAAKLKNRVNTLTLPNAELNELRRIVATVPK